MAEEQTPAISEPFVKANAALSAVLLEIGGNLPKLNRHGNSFVRLAYYGRVATNKQMNVRSEEHTSELQSLMRISYAVFCLKKKILKLEYILNILYMKYYSKTNK